MNRRTFLHTTAATAALGTGLQSHAAERENFSFVLLGDLHLDQLEHHDMAWLKAHKPDDVRQVESYSRLTREITPQLFTTVRNVIAERQNGSAPVAFVLQVGDLVEGLCGNETLALQHNRDALAAVRAANFGVPFLFTKGNHDITGPGATEAFAAVFHPFLDAECARLAPAKPDSAGARRVVTHGNAQFVLFDAYDNESLEWFEAVAARRTAAHCFVAIHPPVVPYGARATWYLYSGAKTAARRAKLLELLAQQNAFVLGGHIHKFNTLSRTVGGQRFAQLAVSSILSSREPTPKDVLSGDDQYTGDQIRVEPNHSPDTAAERRQVYEQERPFVRGFEYADLPGYAIVTVSGSSVRAEIFRGAGRELFRAVALDRLNA
jgi:UDP-2,3-diacylglucosamine pyrophosphatase LpxH